MPKTRPPYPPEFRAEAVRPVRSNGLPLPRASSGSRRSLTCLHRL